MGFTRQFSSQLRSRTIGATEGKVKDTGSPKLLTVAPALGGVALFDLPATFDVPLHWSLRKCSVNGR